MSRHYKLHYAIVSGNCEECKTLLFAGANINEIRPSSNEIYKSSGTTHLQLAIESKNIDICRVLFNYGGASSTTRFPNGPTPFIYAVRHNTIDICNLLLEKGAVIEEEEYCLIHAVMSGYFEMSKFLLERRANVHTKNEKGNNVLQYYYHNNGFEIAKLLLQYKVNVNDANLVGETPLHTAARSNNFIFCKLLW